MLQNGDLVSGTHDSTIKIWNTDDGTLKRTLYGQTWGVKALSAVQNGELASGS